MIVILNSIIKSKMEAKQVEQNVSSTGVSSPESLQSKNQTSPSKRTESSASQSSGAIPKTVTKGKTGVKLGSFRIGGRKKTEGDSNPEVKDEKRKSKKLKKGKTGESDDKVEAEQAEGNPELSTSSVTKQSIPSKATSLVRRLSIGKYKSGGSVKTPKSPDTPSSQEGSQSTNKTDVSTEEDRFSTASSSPSVVTGGRPSMQGDEGIIHASTSTPTSTTSNLPPEDIASPVDQSTASCPADTKVNKSETSISGSRGSLSSDTVPQAMSGIKDPIETSTVGTDSGTRSSLQDNPPELETETKSISQLTTQDETPELVKSEENKAGQTDSDETLSDCELHGSPFAAHSSIEDLTEAQRRALELELSPDISLQDTSDESIFPSTFCKPIPFSEISPIRSIPPPVGVDKISKHDLWFTKKFFEDDDLSPDISYIDPDDKKLTTKDQILSITTPVLLRQRQEAEEYLKLLEPESMNIDPYGVLLPNISKDEELLGLSIEEQGTSGPSVPERNKEVGVKESQDTTTPVANDAMPRLSQNVGNSAQQVGEKREHLYKILVIGELGTGKTSIIKRYVHQFFSQHYRATIGVDFALKVLNWDANTIIRLQLWDIAGQERFGNMTRVYYKEAVGAFIVFDVTRAATFDAVVKWKQDLDTKVQLPDGSAIPCVLLANKCDQQKEGLVNNAPKMDEYCKERGFTAWFETSAKENINIEDAARCLVTKILQNDKMINHSESSKDLERFALDGKNQKDQKSKTCAC